MLMTLNEFSLVMIRGDSALPMHKIKKKMWGFCLFGGSFCLVIFFGWLVWVWGVFGWFFLLVCFVVVVCLRNFFISA